MKKLFYVLMCVLLVTAMAVTAFAAGSAEMTIGASESAVYRGDTVSFTVTISAVEDCRSAGVMLTYDKTVFEFISGRCSVSGTVLANFSDGTGVFAYGSSTAVSGEIFTFQLKVRNDAALGDHSITANGSVRNSDGTIPTTVNTLIVNVGADDTPPTEGTEPVGEETVPTEGTKPVDKDTEPTEETKPVNEATMPTEGTKPVDEDTVPTEGTEPVVEETLPTEGTKPVDEETAPVKEKKPVDANAPAQNNFPWWILVVGAVIAIGGIVTVVVRKKNK